MAENMDQSAYVSSDDWVFPNGTKIWKSFTLNGQLIETRLIWKQDDGTWAYDDTTILKIHGRDEPFLHKDDNRLTRIAPPTPNPLMRGAGVSA